MPGSIPGRVPSRTRVRGREGKERWMQGQPSRARAESAFGALPSNGGVPVARGSYTPCFPWMRTFVRHLEPNGTVMGEWNGLPHCRLRILRDLRLEPAEPSRG